MRKDVGATHRAVLYAIPILATSLELSLQYPAVRHSLQAYVQQQGTAKWSCYGRLMIAMVAS